MQFIIKRLMSEVEISCIMFTFFEKITYFQVNDAWQIMFQVVNRQTAWKGSISLGIS